MVALSSSPPPVAANTAFVLVVTSAVQPLAPLVRLLREVGHHCVVVASVARAVTSILHRKPTLILLDAHAATAAAGNCARLRRKLPGRGTPIILLTTVAADHRGDAPAPEGAVDTIIKPFHAGDVVVRIGAQLQIAALQSQLARERARCEALEKKLAVRDGVESRTRTPASGSPMINFPGSRADEPRSLKSLGLSARETEVLHWMSHGKTTREIAMIIGVAVGTVRKHAEHIYAKLGVEGHRGAMLRAFEVLQAM